MHDIIFITMYFRGNHETGGEFKQGRIKEDVVDLEVVIGYLKSKFGYKIDTLVGHSRGSVVAFHWICKSEDGRRVSAMVNISGRYRMQVSEILSFWVDLTKRPSH
jgi:uncharacterized protein